MSIAMVFGLIPGRSITSSEVMAATNSEPTAAQYIEVNGSSAPFSAYNLNGGTVGKIKFGLDGENSREWHIAGIDEINGNALTLFSTTTFGTSVFDYSLSTYGDIFLGRSSEVLKYLKSTCMTSSFFSDEEKNMMKATNVSTTDFQGGVCYVEDKLYLADALNRDAYGSSTIYLGSRRGIPIDLKTLPDNGGTTSRFWLRSPSHSNMGNALAAIPGSVINSNVITKAPDKEGAVSVVPA